MLPKFISLFHNDDVKVALVPQAALLDFKSPKASQQHTPLTQNWMFEKIKIAIIWNCMRKNSFNLILTPYGLLLIPLPVGL